MKLESASGWPWPCGRASSRRGALTSEAGSTRPVDGGSAPPIRGIPTKRASRRMASVLLSPPPGERP
jgi:hypothetical protein